MSRYWFGLISLLCSLSLTGQYQYLRLNHLNEARYGSAIYSLESDYHSSVRPLNIWQIDSLRSGVPDSAPKSSKSWLYRKLFLEHLVDINKPEFAIMIDPIVNFQGGFDPEFSGDDVLFVNTRGFNLEGRIGQHFTFQTSYLENQARFPDYIADFEREHHVIPGQGFARTFNETGFDYGMASGEVSYTPNHHFSFTLGQGRNFFGEGYRSMMLSDVAYNYPFFRIETDFWRIKYVNLWAQHYDVRPEAEVNGVYAKKYLASHYLSINISKRWNLSFFESIVFGDTAQQRGIDVSFFNPVIFFRPLEFAVGSRGSNALLGTALSYKIADGAQAYGQFVLDEFNLSAFLNEPGSWLNKYGWQLGLKYYDAFDVNGLFARVEYNGARPYTYSHREPISNYGHYGQPLAHPWGSNFHEVLLHGLYQKNRWEFDLRYHFGLMGLDFDSINYGADIYRSYNDNRASDNNNPVAQGATSTYHFVHARVAWVVNPASGLKLEAGARWRSLKDENGRADLTPINTGASNYYYIGLRTEFFNNYYDF
jgi:hypothetical protein